VIFFLPEVISLEILKGNKDYLKWLKGELKFPQGKII